MGKVVSLDAPVADLKESGIRLQAQLYSTHERLAGIKDYALKLEARRVLDRTGYVFRTVSQTVQMVDSTRRVMEHNFGLSGVDLMKALGFDKKTAAITARGTVELINNAVSLALHDLDRINSAMDKEKEKENAH
jgi:hypothetical protein